MTAAGWIFLGLAWSGVGGLVLFCAVRLLRNAPPAARDPDPSPGAERPH